MFMINFLLSNMGIVLLSVFLNLNAYCIKFQLFEKIQQHSKHNTILDRESFLSNKNNVSDFGITLNFFFID